MFSTLNFSGCLKFGLFFGNNYSTFLQNSAIFLGVYAVIDPDPHVECLVDDHIENVFKVEVLQKLVLILDLDNREY
jgi:hypothetical protein